MPLSREQVRNLDAYWRAAHYLTVGPIYLQENPLLREPLPNPTAAGATFKFSLRAPGSVELDLYNVAGQRVRRLANGAYGAGEQILRWNGTDDAGRTLAAGVYFVNLRAGGVSATRKLLVTP